MKYSAFFIFLFCVIGTSFAQKQLKTEPVINSYRTYFELPRESLFLHLNKSTYITGESLWFKGYVYNTQTEKPFVETSNILVGIYDSIGNQVSKKQFISFNGYTRGNIVIDSTFTSGSYYIKATTNWMHNFKEEGAFIQKITIYNTQIPPKKKEIAPQYDIQFLPEGGSLIRDIKNTVGVKVIDQNGHGVPFKKAVLHDSFEYELLSFHSSRYGLSKFDITPKEDVEYIATITLKDDTQITATLPKALKEGIGLSVSDHTKSQIAITIKSNEQTRLKVKDAPLSIFIHRDGKAQVFDITIPENINYASFLVDKSTLYKGVNIITLFDAQNQPISERLYFHMDDISLESTIAITTHKIPEEDSLRVSLKMSVASTTFKNLSVSILPTNTTSYTHKNTILSAFYLQPYLKGTIENPSYYFKNMNASKKAALDLLLLTQGWSTYNWHEIFTSPPKKTYAFEQGVHIKGTIHSKLRDTDQIYLHPGIHHKGHTIAITNNTFTLDNTYPEHGDTLKFSLIKPSGRLTVPKLYLTSTNPITKDRIDKPWTPKKVKKTAQTVFLSEELPEFYQEEEVTELYEVVLEGKKRSVSKDDANLPTFVRGRVTEVTQETVVGARRFADIIRSRGYEVTEQLEFAPRSGEVSRVSIRTRTVQSLQSDIERTNPKPIIYLDGVQLSHFDILIGLKTEDVESYYFDRSGATAGSRGAGGVIYINRRKNFEAPLPPRYAQKKVTPKKVYAYPIPYGFEKTKTFYTPQYKTYTDDAFKSFGVIHWEPDVIITDHHEATFNMLDTGLQNISFYIEGMSENGMLFSIIKTIDTQKNSH